MVGLELPVLAMEHQYLITEDMPEVVDSATEMLHVIDFEGEIYMRQEGGGMLIGTYEQACVPWSERDAVGFRPGPVAQRSRPHRAQPRDRLQAFPGARAGGHQAHRQRALHLRARRQSADRPDPRPAQLLGRLRRHGRLQPGRRRRPGARQLDGRRRSRLRRLGDGRRALRRLGDDGLHQRQGARELFAPLPHPLSQRGAARRAAAAHHADLRPAEGRERRVRRILGPRTGAVVRAQGQPSRSRTSRSAARTPMPMSAKECAPSAPPSGCSKYRITGNSKYAAPARSNGSPG